jgi:hypothetical protein
MRLNKREKIAIETMRKILNAIENGETIRITDAQNSAVSEILNINLKRNLFKKKIAKFVRGKTDFHLEILAPYSENSYKNSIKKHYFFPFQIALSVERKKEIEELEKRGIICKK